MYIFCFDLAVSGQRSPQHTIQRTIQWLYSMMTSQFVECSIYFISRDPVSSNQMTTIYIGII